MWGGFAADAERLGYWEREKAAVGQGAAGYGRPFGEERRKEYLFARQKKSVCRSEERHTDKGFVKKDAAYSLWITFNICSPRPIV